MRIFLDEKLGVSPGACLRALYREYPEHPCADVCPREAITFDPLSVDFGLCDDCGICAGVCPTDALRIRESYYGKVFKSACPGEGGEIRIRCSAATGECTEVQCLGALDAAFLAMLGAKSKKKIRLITGDCGKCDKAPGGEVARSNADTALKVLSMYKTDAWISLVDSGEAGGTAGYSRRGLFKGMGTALSKFVTGVQPDGREEAAGRRSVPGKRLRMLAVIKGLDAGAERVAPGSHLPFYGKEIDGSSCDGCRGLTRCVTFCPTGALALSSGKESSSGITFEAGRCIGCDMCATVCAKKAVTSKPLDLTESDELWQTRRLVSFETRRCEECDNMSIDIRDGLCPDCLQRERKLSWESV